MKYVLIDCCPVPAKLAEEIRELKRLTGATLTSCYRGDDARDLLHHCGKQSQKQLYDGWLNRRLGYNPANPPGRSTHELRNDGVAYRWLPAGAPIPYWTVGMDWDDGHVGAVCRAARKRGWVVTVTYPGDRREYHHLNFRKRPILRLFRALKQGSKGRRVATMTARLAYLGYLPGVNPRRGTGGFGPKVEAALRQFQHDHHLGPDGVYGIHTERQLLASVARRKRDRRKTR